MLFEWKGEDSAHEHIDYLRIINCDCDRAEKNKKHGKDHRSDKWKSMKANPYQQANVLKIINYTSINISYGRCTVQLYESK